MQPNVGGVHRRDDQWESCANTCKTDQSILIESDLPGVALGTRVDVETLSQWVARRDLSLEGLRLRPRRP
jgi:hypothetical protein